MSNKVVFVMGDGNKESMFGLWVGVYVNDELKHEGEWPIPFNVLREIMEADVCQVTIPVRDVEVPFDAKVDFSGLPETYDDLGNTIGMEVVGFQEYKDYARIQTKKMAAAAERIAKDKARRL